MTNVKEFCHGQRSIVLSMPDTLTLH